MKFAKAVLCEAFCFYNRILQWQWKKEAQFMTMHGIH